MKKVIRKIFMMVVLVALVFLGVRFGPNLYVRLFGSGNVQWVSERFSETLREKNRLMVYEVETTGQETVTQDAWLIGTVQKVVMPYTFQMNFTVDLSNAVVTASGSTIEVHVPSPVPGYQKLTVDEADMKKNDWLYPLTPERYAQIKQTVEDRLFEEASSNEEYIQNAWNVTVRNLETLFGTVVESNEWLARFTITVIRDDTLGQPEESPAQMPDNTLAPAA